MARTCLPLCFNVVLYLTAAIGFADGPWTVEIGDNGFVFVSISDSDFRGTWLLDLKTAGCFTNSASSVNWDDSPLDERFGMRTELRVSTDEPLMRKLSTMSIKDFAPADLSFLDSNGIHVRGTLGRIAVRDLRVQFFVRNGKPMVELSEIGGKSHFDSSSMGNAIPLNFDKETIMSSIFNIGAKTIELEISTIGAQDFYLPLEIIQHLKGRRSRKPLTIQKSFSSEGAVISNEHPSFSWCVDKLYFEGVDLTHALIGENRDQSINLGCLLRRNACFVMDGYPVLYLSKTDNQYHTSFGLKEVYVHSIEGTYRVRRVPMEGRLHDIFLAGDEFNSIDGQAAEKIPPDQFYRLCMDCFERGAPIEIRRDGVVQKITKQIPKLSFEEVVDQFYLPSGAVEKPNDGSK